MTTTTDQLTCPVCEQPMPARNAHGGPRVVCSTDCAHERSREGRNARVEDVEDLLSMGECPERIARRLDVTLAALSRQLMRAGRYDLARPFNALDHRQRDARKRTP